MLYTSTRKLRSRLSPFREYFCHTSGSHGSIPTWLHNQQARIMLLQRPPRSEPNMLRWMDGALGRARCPLASAFCRTRSSESGGMHPGGEAPPRMTGVMVCLVSAGSSSDDPLNIWLCTTRSVALVSTGKLHTAL